MSLVTNLQDWKTLSEIFNNVFVGIGVSLAGGGGLKILLDWANNWNEARRRDRLRGELKARYPLNKFGRDFRLIETDFPSGWVYLHDLKTNEKHHIASILTLIKLGFNRNKVEKISQERFDSIDNREEFLTDGERYS